MLLLYQCVHGPHYVVNAVFEPIAGDMLNAINVDVQHASNAQLRKKRACVRML